MAGFDYSAVQSNLFKARSDASWDTLTFLVRQKKTEMGVLLHFTLELTGDFFVHIDSAVELKFGDYLNLDSLADTLFKNMCKNEEYSEAIGDFFVKLASSFTLLTNNEGALFEEKPTQKFVSKMNTATP